MPEYMIQAVAASDPATVAIDDPRPWTADYITATFKDNDGKVYTTHINPKHIVAVTEVPDDK